MIFAKWICFAFTAASWCYGDPAVYGQPRTDAGCHAMMRQMAAEVSVEKWGELGRDKIEYQCVKVSTRFGE